MGLAVVVLAGFVAAVLLPVLHRSSIARVGWAAVPVPLGIAAWLIARTGHVLSGEVITYSVSWVPALDVYLAFRLDGLALLFSLLVSLVGAVVFAYGADYMRKHESAGRFHGYMMLFMASMLGLVLADNLITLYVFFELTSIASWLLIGFDHENADARRSARQALIVTTAGGLALLAGLILAGRVAGTYTLSALLGNPEILRESTLYVPILICVVAAAFTKSAQLPFSFWLPNAMRAPTPVSAYLHSAAMVKAGIYLLARFHPVLGDSLWWTAIVGGTGAATMLVGSWLALRRRDLKQILAWSTVMALGMIVMMLGIGSAPAVAAALLYVVVHAAYKAGLFMAAGSIERATGERDINRLGRLVRGLPTTFAAVALAALSMAGIAPLSGFLGKEAIYASLLNHPFAPGLWSALAVAANVALAGVSILLIVDPFFRASSEKDSGTGTLGAVPTGMIVASLLPGVYGLLFFIAPATVGADVVSSAASLVVGEHTDLHVSRWPGLSPEFLLSLLTVAGGLVVYAMRDRLRDASLLAWVDALGGRGPDRVFERSLDALLAGAGRLSSILQHGRLRGYVAIVTVSIVVFVGAALRFASVTPDWPTMGDVRAHEWAIIAAILSATLTAVVVRSRLATVLSLSVVSYGIAAIFLLYGAPDIALTLVLVETLLAVLVVVAFVDLPRLKHFTPPGGHIRDALIALAAGASVTGLMLAGLDVPFDSSVGDFFWNNSVDGAHGRNVVNTILVDFRALDTLGEIGVLAIAGLSVYALVQLRGPVRRTSDGSSESEDQNTSSQHVSIRPSLILRITCRLLTPVMLLFAFYLLFTGHHRPGGGFSAGLVAAGALGLSAIAYGVDEVRRITSRIDPRRITGFGLLLAVVSGCMALVSGGPFLESRWISVPLPFREPLVAGTPSLFDAGVFFVVVGVVLTIVFVLEEAGTSVLSKPDQSEI